MKMKVIRVNKNLYDILQFIDETNLIVGLFCEIFLKLNSHILFYQYLWYTDCNEWE